MSEVNLIIADRHRRIAAHRHGGFADAAIAALCDDPETIEELDAAMERFIAPNERGNFHNFHSSPINHAFDAAPHDAGLVIIDLAARLIVCESTWSSPCRDGWVPYHDGSRATETEIRYHLSSDWHFLHHAIDWEIVADRRRAERAANPPLDARAILYGEPLLEHIARECLRHFSGRPLPDKSTRTYDETDTENNLFTQIHADWMLTPRIDLRGSSPREIMLKDHDYVDWGRQDRTDQWSLTLKPPRGISPESAAYRFAGFGTHEFVIHYELVRHLLYECRRRIHDLPRHGADLPPAAAADFIKQELTRLATLRDEYLDRPEPEFSSRTPRRIIHNERIRLPEVASAREAVIDPDCPCCQLNATARTPIFWFLDGAEMDDDFAFDMKHATREDWEAERRKWDDFNRKFNEEREQERASGKTPQQILDEQVEHDLRIFEEARNGNPDDPEETEATFVRLFNLGAKLAALITALKEIPRTGPTIDRLNRAYANLAHILQNGDTQTTDLATPILERLCESLDITIAEHPDLEPACLAVRHRAERLLGALDAERIPLEDDFDNPYDLDDDDADEPSDADLEDDDIPF